MIVRKEPEGSLILINQTDHAKLSGIFAAHWGNADFARPTPWDSVVRGVAFHDCGWLTYESSPICDPATKAPPNFQQVPLDATQLRAFQNGLDWIWGVDPYAGLLVSRHRTGLWQKRYGAIVSPASGSARVLSDEVHAFIQRNEAKQEALTATLDRSEVEINYQLLQVMDLLSLYLCTSEPKVEQIGLAPTRYDGASGAGAMLTLTPASATRIVIDPWPLDVPELEASFVYRHVKSTFETQEAFRAAYFGAAPQVMSFIFAAKR